MLSMGLYKIEVVESVGSFELEWPRLGHSGIYVPRQGTERFDDVARGSPRVPWCSRRLAGKTTLIDSAIDVGAAGLMQWNL